jgi:hypothetical protein
MYRVQQLAPVLVAMILCTGFLVRDAVAQVPPPCDKTAINCKQTVTTVATVPVANGIGTGTGTVTGTAVVTNTQQQTVSNTLGDTTWQGLNWGIGIASTFNLGGKLVTGAEIMNNVVRVTDTSSNVGVGFVLEAHYYFKEWLPTTNCMSLNCNNIATGPFVALQVGTGASSSAAADGLITSYALGWMIGLHHPDSITSKTANSTWNFGVGLVVNPTAKGLGDGFNANQPPPPGEPSAIRYVTGPRYGVMLLTSFSF